jgi:hypothetical protein
MDEGFTEQIIDGLDFEAGQALLPLIAAAGKAGRQFGRSAANRSRDSKMAAFFFVFRSFAFLMEGQSRRVELQLAF